MATSTQYKEWERYVTLNKIDIQSLIDLAEKATPPLSRFCLHRTPNHQLNEMVVAIRQDFWVPPHRQLGREKSYTLIKGDIGVLFYEDNGELSDIVHLTSPDCDGSFICRFDAGRWHTVICRYEHGVYLESITGPFTSSMTEWMIDGPPMEDKPCLEKLRKRVFS